MDQVLPEQWKKEEGKKSETVKQQYAVCCLASSEHWSLQLSTVYSHWKWIAASECHEYRYPVFMAFRGSNPLPVIKPMDRSNWCSHPKHHLSMMGDFPEKTFRDLYREVEVGKSACWAASAQILPEQHGGKGNQVQHPSEPLMCEGQDDQTQYLCCLSLASGQNCPNEGSQLD